MSARLHQRSRIQFGGDRAVTRSDDMAGPPNLAANRLPPSSRLAGSTIAMTFDRGERLSLAFNGADRVAWRWDNGRGGGPDRCDVVALRAGAFFVAVDIEEPATDALIVTFLEEGPALAVRQTRLSSPNPAGTAVANVFLAGRVDGSSAQPPMRTDALLGHWHQIRYSDANLYEHIYLSSDRFCSHNLATENTAGRADCHPVDYWRLASELYVVAWRERGSGAAMTIVEDLQVHRATGVVLHPASRDRSVLIPIGGNVQVLRLADDRAELEARAAASGWEAGDPI